MDAALEEDGIGEMFAGNEDNDFDVVKEEEETPVVAGNYICGEKKKCECVSNTAARAKMYKGSAL